MDEISDAVGIVFGTESPNLVEGCSRKFAPGLEWWHHAGGCFRDGTHKEEMSYVRREQGSHPPLFRGDLG